MDGVRVRIPSHLIRQAIATAPSSFTVYSREPATGTNVNSRTELQTLLESVFSQIGSATVVYDFFGRVLKANEVSETLLRPENLSPTKANALEFLRLVTGRGDAEIRGFRGLTEGEYRR